MEQYREKQMISIHTPAKGVTRIVVLQSVKYQFQSTAKGVTSRGRGNIRELANFNPHSREGSDINCATSHREEVNFNPHSREGSDDGFNNLKDTLGDFNPHSREGSDYVIFPDL